MAEKLTDAEIAEELRRHGETVKLPIDRKKRPILIKKLNHFRAREKPSPQKKSSHARQRAPVVENEFSSEDEEDEETRATSTLIFGRKKKNADSTHSYSNTDTIEITPPRRSSRASRNDSNVSFTRRSTGGKGSLYPDLSEFVATSHHHTKGVKGNDIVMEEEVFNFQEEFTDSDPEESVYEVENRSMNTTFSLQENVDGYDSRPSSSRAGITRRSIGQNQTLRSKLNASSVGNHTPSQNDPHETGTWSERRQFKPAKASFISTAILIFVGIFFILLAASYIYIRKDILLSGSSVDESQTHASNFDCPPSQETCMEIKNLSLMVVNEYERILKGKAEKMKVGELKKEVNKIPTFSSNKDLKTKEVHSLALHFICQNTHWNIRAYDKEGNLLSDPKSEDVVYLETDPELDIFTRLGRSIWKILFGLMLLLCCLLCMVLGIMLLRYHNKSKEEEQKKVFNLVDNIIEIIEKNYEHHQEDSCTPPYMAVSHVRDQLIPPKERQKMRPLWDQAVKFIEANESRIRIETQTVQGEDFQVWRWLPPSANGGKVWQGRAFGEGNSPSLAPHYSPTQCLKIRNMFDADVETDDWEVSVKDAVLEKCKDVDGILHMFVDANSKEGCVYMKCDSFETAYKVYKALHGWWFDGRLVTVKYLRLELYHKKFPDSRRATTSLKPSNSNMASLSQPYHRSSLEMT